MRQEIMRKVLLVVLVLGVCALFDVQCDAKAVVVEDSAALDETEEAHIAFIVDEGVQMPVNALMTMSGDGKVMGDGVRLRKGPSSSAGVLELMYRGEFVIVRSLNNPDWPKVKRCKTGTIGYVSRDYLVIIG